jgi:hypothetical protein
MESLIFCLLLDSADKNPGPADYNVKWEFGSKYSSHVNVNFPPDKSKAVFFNFFALYNLSISSSGS